MKLILLFLTSLPLSVWANPNLNLIKDIEWKGACRKVVNEANQVIKGEAYARLQTSYSFRNGELVQWVKSFTDNNCQKIFDGNKLTFKCAFTAKSRFANCKRVKLESTKDGVAWTAQTMQPDAFGLKIKLASTTKNKVKITTIGESEDPNIEVLQR